LSKKIYIFSDMFLPTFPYLELPLYNYLVKQGVDVTYVLQDGDVRLNDDELFDTFSKLNLKTISSPKKIVQQVGANKGDLLLSRFDYKRQCAEAATVFKSIGTVFMYDPSGIDIRVRQCPAHYLTAKSKALKQATLRKFPRAYKNIFTTGTIHYDAAATTKVNRDDFMRSYDLDSRKKLLILTPANPGEAWMEGLQNDYKRIVEIVITQCPDYELAIKCHPLDYAIKKKSQPGIVHKNQHYGGKGSWEILAPNLPLIKPEEGYMAIKACDVVLNIRSSLAMETPMFYKPILNINRSKYVTNWPFDSGVMIDIEMDELAHVLNTNNYGIDEGACISYVKREAYSDDGKAYVRIGDIAIKIINGVL